MPHSFIHPSIFLQSELGPYSGSAAAASFSSAHLLSPFAVKQAAAAGTFQTLLHCDKRESRWGKQRHTDKPKPSTYNTHTHILHNLKKHEWMNARKDLAHHHHRAKQIRKRMEKDKSCNVVTFPLHPRLLHATSTSIRYTEPRQGGWGTLKLSLVLNFLLTAMLFPS